jgi:hypothetical protein
LDDAPGNARDVAGNLLHWRCTHPPIIANKLHYGNLLLTPASGTFRIDYGFRLRLSDLWQRLWRFGFGAAAGGKGL